MGKHRSCIKFRKVQARTAKGKKAAFRCVEYKEGLKHPKKPPTKLAGGGRSQWYIRPPGKS